MTHARTLPFVSLLSLLPLLIAIGCGDDGMPTDTGTGDTAVGDTGTGDTGTGDTGTGDTGTGDTGTGDAGDAGDGGPCVVTGDERTWAECTDGIDNDCDGDIDTDVGCSICPPDAATEAGGEETAAFCADGIDNDCDGRVDCGDSSCREVGAGCGDETDDETLCSDGIDNDGDGRVDCGERGCATTMACRPATMTATEDDATLCGNGLDDDYNGRTDCDDASCDGIGFCGTEDDDTACADGNDNDGDGYTDCLDSDCSDVAACMGEDTDAACSNGTDDDGDGDIDCRDRDCIGNPVCVDSETICDDAMDNDSDGRADCQDDDCAAGCTGMACSATNWFGTCTGTDTCARGVCATDLSTFDLTTEQPLLITEIMPNPDATSDSNGEYVEVTNMSTATIDVIGLVISDSAGTPTAEVLSSIALGPGEKMVFVANEEAGLNGGITNGVEFDFSLNQGGDDAAISYMGTEIHRVTYPGTGNDLTNTGNPATAAQSIQLDQGFIEGSTTTAVWCLTPNVAGNVYFTDPVDSDVDYGTPGVDNLLCP